MYDELVKRLQDFAASTARDDDAQLAFEAVDAIEELSKPRWISVEEALPKDLTRVIVYCEDGVSYGICQHLIADDEEIVEWHDFLHYPITPTHWMPLPQPPKESEP